MVKKAHKQPLFNNRIRDEIILRHKKEKAYNKDPNEYTLNTFYQQRRHVSNLIKTARKDSYVNKLLENKNDFKRVFENANELLFQNEEMPLPPCEDKKKLADQFNSFFIMKIDKILEGSVQTDIHLVTPDYLVSEMETTVTLHEFRPVILDETNKLILSATSKSCKLDPIPMKLLKPYQCTCTNYSENYHYLNNQWYNIFKYEGGFTQKKILYNVYDSFVHTFRLN